MIFLFIPLDGIHCMTSIPKWCKHILHSSCAWFQFEVVSWFLEQKLYNETKYFDSKKLPSGLPKGGTPWPPAPGRRTIVIAGFINACVLLLIYNEELPQFTLFKHTYIWLHTYYYFSIFLIWYKKEHNYTSSMSP